MLIHIIQGPKNNQNLIHMYKIRTYETNNFNYINIPELEKSHMFNTAEEIKYRNIDGFSILTC